MTKWLAVLLAGSLVSGCSLLAPEPAPDLTDIRQPDPPWRIAEDLTPPAASPICEFAHVDYGVQDRIVLTVGYEERALPLHDCTVGVPVDKGQISFHLHGRYLKSEFRSQLTGGRLSNGYQVNLTLVEGETVTLTVTGVGEGGTDVSYTLRGIETGDYRIETGPTAQGPWRELTNGEVVDGRFLRLRFPRAVNKADMERLFSRTYDWTPDAGTATWLDEKTMVYEVAGDVPGLLVSDLLDVGGYAIRPSIRSVYFGPAPRVVRLDPKTAAEQEVVRLIHAPFFNMQVVGGALYQHTGSTAWRTDLATGERSEAPWPANAEYSGYHHWDQSPDRRHRANWEYPGPESPGWDGSTIVQLTLTLNSERGQTRLEEAAGAVLSGGGCSLAGPAFAWSPDSRTLALKDVLSAGQVAVVLLDPEENSRRTLVTLNESWRDAARWGLSYSPDGKYLVLGPHVIDVSAGRVLTTAPAEGTVTWSEDGRYMLMSQHHSDNFGTRMYRLDTQDLSWVDLGHGQVVHTMPNGELLVVRWEQPRQTHYMRECY